MVKVRFWDANHRPSSQKRRTEPLFPGFFPPSPPSLIEAPAITRDIIYNTHVEGTSQKHGPRDSEGCPPLKPGGGRTTTGD
jgi:hypothetical protein